MKRSNWLVCAVLGGALILQGCAATGDTRPDSTAQAANAVVPAAASDSKVAISQEGGKLVVKADSKENLEAVMAAIHQQMLPGGRWQFVDKNQRTTIDSRFADMQLLFDRYGSMAQMNEEAKLQLFNDQEAINGILTQRDGDRLICTQEIPVGSHLPVKTCRTYGQMERERQNTRRFFQDQMETKQNWSGG